MIYKYFDDKTTGYNMYNTVIILHVFFKLIFYKVLKWNTEIVNRFTRVNIELNLFENVNCIIASTCEGQFSTDYNAYGCLNKNIYYIRNSRSTSMTLQNPKQTSKRFLNLRRNVFLYLSKKGFNNNGYMVI